MERERGPAREAQGDCEQIALPYDAGTGFLGRLVFVACRYIYHQGALVLAGTIEGKQQGVAGPGLTG